MPANAGTCLAKSGIPIAAVGANAPAAALCMPPSVCLATLIPEFTAPAMLLGNAEAACSIPGAPRPPVSLLAIPEAAPSIPPGIFFNAPCNAPDTVPPMPLAACDKLAAADDNPCAACVAELKASPTFR